MAACSEQSLLFFNRGCPSLRFEEGVGVLLHGVRWAAPSLEEVVSTSAEQVLVVQGSAEPCVSFVRVAEVCNLAFLAVRLGSVDAAEYGTSLRRDHGRPASLLIVDVDERGNEHGLTVAPLETM